MKVRPRVRRLPSGTIKTLWECDLGKINGKRVAPCFRTKDEAEERLRQTREKLKHEGQSAFLMTDADRVEWRSAREALAGVGATLPQAVAFYLKHHGGIREEITLEELLNRCVFEKEVAGLRSRYITQFGVSCRSFIMPRLGQLAHTVTRQEIQEWISGNGWAEKTQRGYHGDLRSLFSWGLDNGHLAQNPAAGKFRFIASEPKEIAALTAYQAAELLRQAAQIPPPSALGRRVRYEHPPLLWYVVLGLFAGIRPEREMGKLDRSKVDLVGKHVVIEGRISKTRQRRVVDLTKEAVAWLKLDPRCEGPVVPPNFRLLWGRLREAAGWRAPAWTHRRSSEGREGAAGAAEDRPVWPHDAMRHTFASMHYAKHQNESLLKAQMGHSEDEDTLMQHYRALRTRAEAKKFWGLTPSNTCLSPAP